MKSNKKLLGILKKNFPRIEEFIVLVEKLLFFNFNLQKKTIKLFYLR